MRYLGGIWWSARWTTIWSRWRREKVFYIGLDLGKRRDPAAIAVVESVERGRAFQAPLYRTLGVRQLERVALGTPYPLVVDRVREIVQSDGVQGECVVVADATGVGDAVVDLLRRARLGCEICAVTITGGEGSRAHGWPGGGGWNVPKQDLIGAVQVALEKGELRIAKRMREVGSLVRELLDLQMTTKSSGAVRIGADGYGQHDDLAIALALACWRARRGLNSYGGRPLPGVNG
jgi:hypothetical protein